jgi:hypothetical protein
MKNTAYPATGLQPMATRPEWIVAALDKSSAQPTRIVVRALPLIEQSEINPD